jgi:predicted house-cleaning noncanonical NTP pyrophosphatase (MazG superfamily)
VQTTRAEELADFLEVFERFLIAREATLDQIAAERALGRLMGPDR